MGLLLAYICCIDQCFILVPTQALTAIAPAPAVQQQSCYRRIKESLEGYETSIYSQVSQVSLTEYNKQLVVNF